MTNDEGFELTPPPAAAASDPQQDAARRHRAATLGVMVRRYGPPPDGVTCGGCAHLVRSGGGAGAFPKCRAFRISCSAATDWRLRWPGCGKYEKAREGGR